MRKVIFLIAIALLVYAWAASTSDAATFRLEDGEVCDFSLNGRIETGDALELRRFLSDADIPEIGPLGSPLVDSAPIMCLNSPGGSLVEAAEIARWVSFGFATRIRANEQCLSACAWVFMLGQSRFNDVATTNRAMSAYGTLGFHALSFDIPEGEYNNQEIVRAINVMNEAFSVILNLSSGSIPGDSSIGNDLVHNAMATASDEFYLIENVGQVLRWRIDVFDIPAFDPSRYLTRLAEFNACDNARRSSYHLWHNHPSNTSWENSFNFSPEQTIREANQTNFVLTLRARSGDRCEGDLAISQDVISNTHQYQVCHSDASNAGSCTYSPLALLPGDTPLVALAGAEGLRLYTELTTTVAPEPPATTCHLEASQARITNVNQYTNLRSGAGITQPIVTRVPLNAMVRQAAQGYYYASQRCLQICDNGDQRQIAQCIESNDVWIEVTYNGRRGFLSRQFLEAP